MLIPPTYFLPLLLGIFLLIVIGYMVRKHHTSQPPIQLPQPIARHLQATRKDVDIRVFSIDDAASVQQLAQKNRAHLRHFMPHMLLKYAGALTEVQKQLKYDHREATRWMQHHPSTIQNFSMGIFVQDQCLGMVGLHDLGRWGEKTCEIGYWVSKEAQGQGIAQAAVVQFIYHILFKNTQHLQQVFIIIDIKNEASQEVAIHIGATPYKHPSAHPGKWLWYQLENPY